MRLLSGTLFGALMAAVVVFGGVPSAGAASSYPVSPNDNVAPPDNTVERSGAGWTVHGTFGGVAYTYRNGAPFVLVSNQKNQGWKSLDLDNSWMVRCYVDDNVPNCTVTRVSTIGGAGRFVSFGFSDGDEACFFSSVLYAKIDVTIDDSPGGTAFTHDHLCTDGEGAALLQKLLAGKTFSLKSNNGTVDTTYNTYGLKQALAMRDWILAQHRAGKLNAKAQ
jgi:hypothetical protein